MVPFHEYDVAMECTFCPGNQATCHLTKVVNGKSVEVHVCEKCIPEIKSSDLIDFDIWKAVAKLAAAKGKGDPTKAIEVQPPISAKSLLMPSHSVRGSTCPTCGFTSEDLKKTGRLGCPDCYETFAEILADVLRDCQKGTEHHGKVPRSFNSLHRQHLEESLRRAIESERFEEAAILRDQLRSLDHNP